jgi:hypothetical protein
LNGGSRPDRTGSLGGATNDTDTNGSTDSHSFPEPVAGAERGAYLRVDGNAEHLAAELVAKFGPAFAELVGIELFDLIAALAVTR